MRAKKPATGDMPYVEDDENEELVWARLREHASGGDSRTPVTSEVVARSRSGADEYSSYANFAQQEASASYAHGADEEEDDPELWERLRANAAHEGPRMSDVAPRGSHQAWETQGAGGGYAAQADYYAEQEAQYAQQQAEAEYYAQRQAEADYYAAQQAEAAHHAHQQAEAEYYAQQQAEAEYYAQQQAQQHAQQQAQYAQPEYAQEQPQYAQPQYAQPQYAQPYQPAPSFAQSGGSPYAAAPAVGGYPAQPSWQQPASHQILDDTLDMPKRGGALKWLGLLVVGGGLAAGGATAYPHVLQQLKPAQLAPAAISALPLAASPPAPVGAEEARARDALFGTQTAPAAAAPPTPSDPTAAAEEAPPPAAAPEPAAPAPAPAAAAPEPAEQEFSALTGGAPSKKGGKKAKGKAGKKASKLAAPVSKRSLAPAAPRPKRTRGGSGAGLAGGENSNDPLMGI